MFAGIGFVHLNVGIYVVVSLLDVRHPVLGVRALDEAAAGRMISGDGQEQHIAVAQREAVLHQPLAEAGLSHDQAPVPVLDRTRYDLGRRSTGVVDHHDKRDVASMLGVGGINLAGVGNASSGIDDFSSASDELAGYVNGRREQTACIPSKVQQELPHALRLEFLESLFQLLSGGLGKPDNADVSHPGPEDEMVGHAFYGHRIPNDLKLYEILYPLPFDGHRHRGALRPLQPLIDFVCFYPDRGLSIDFDDLIPGADAEPIRGSPGEGSDHGQHAVPDVEADADALVFALKSFLHTLVVVRPDVAAMGIQSRQDPFDRAVYELGAVGRVHVVVPDECEHIPEESELGDDIGA